MRKRQSLFLLQALSSSSWALQLPLPLPLPAASRPALSHLRGGLFRSASPELEALTNTRIPRSDGGELLAHVATPKGGQDGPGGGGGGGGDTVILLHEFFGLSPSIVEKADALAEDLGCVVIAPDMFRGETSSFIPRVSGCSGIRSSERDDRCHPANLQIDRRRGTRLRVWLWTTRTHHTTPSPPHPVNYPATTCTIVHMAGTLDANRACVRRPRRRVALGRGERAWPARGDGLLLRRRQGHPLHNGAPALGGDRRVLW